MAAKKPVKTVRMRRLAAFLRESRLAAGLSPEEAAAAADVSRAWIYRAEKAEVHPQANNVKAVLRAYGVTDEDEIRRIAAIARDAARPNWWESYDLSSDHASFVALEAEASQKFVWESSLIPGLLQTPRYARAVTMAGPDELAPDRVEELVQVRVERQKLLFREEPLQLTAIIDQAVLGRMAGSAGIMHEQLMHLREMAEVPNVTVSVLPAAVGAHPGMNGPFAILQFPDDTDSDLVYCEMPAGAAFLEKPQEVERTHRVFSRLAALSATPSDTIDLVARYAADL